MADHVFGVHAFGRLDVMCATSGMDVMIARPPTSERWIDPTNSAECICLKRSGDDQFRLLRNALRSAREDDGVFAFRQFDGIAVAAVNLRVKSEVGRESFGDVGINALLPVANEKGPQRRLTVLVEHTKHDCLGGRSIKEHVGIIAETEILRALADVEGDSSFTLAGIAA